MKKETVYAVALCRERSRVAQEVCAFAAEVFRDHFYNEILPVLAKNSKRTKRNQTKVQWIIVRTQQKIKEQIEQYAKKEGILIEESFLFAIFWRGNVNCLSDSAWCVLEPCKQKKGRQVYLLCQSKGFERWDEEQDSLFAEIFLFDKQKMERRIREAARKFAWKGPVLYLAIGEDKRKGGVVNEAFGTLSEGASNK